MAEARQKGKRKENRRETTGKGKGMIKIREPRARIRKKSRGW